MGLFKKKITDQLYAGSQFFQNGRVAGKPKDRRDFYAKAIEAARKSDNTAVRNADIENYICFLLTDTGPKADLGLVRRLIAQQEPEEFRRDISAWVDEMERLGIGKVGDSRQEMQDFLLKAAGNGSFVAADIGWRVYGTNRYSLGTRGGEFEKAFIEAAFSGYGPAAAVFLAREKQRAQNGDTPHQLKFWDEFVNVTLAGSRPLPPLPESLGKLDEARRLDESVVQATKVALTEEWDQMRRRRDQLLSRISELEACALRDEGPTMDEVLEEISCFCDWILVREEMYSFSRENRGITLEGSDEEKFSHFEGMACRAPLEPWSRPDYGREAETLFRRGRSLEHQARRFPEIVRLYRQAAELGHGEAMYRLHSMGSFWPGATNGWDSIKYDPAKFGWPMAGSWRHPIWKSDDMACVFQLARQGDVEGIRHISEMLIDLRQKYRGDTTGIYKAVDWECETIMDLQMEYTGLLSDMGDTEAAFHLVWLHFLYDSEKLQRRFWGTARNRCQKELFRRGGGLGCYLAPCYNDVFGIASEDSLAVARKAEEMGLTGAVEALRLHFESIEQAARANEAQRQAYQRMAMVEARREAVAQGMDEYRSKLDWAERAHSYGTGGSGVTREEAHLLGEVSTEQYTRERLIRSELEDSQRRKLEDAFDSSHGFKDD